MRADALLPSPVDPSPEEDALTSNERFKRRSESWFWVGMIVAVVVHFAVFAAWPEMTAADVTVHTPVTDVIDIPPDVAIPDEPEYLEQPASPIADPDVSPDVTIRQTDWDSNPVPEIAPPVATETRDSLGDAESFTPFTVPPRVLNPDEVARALERRYPPTLRDAGVGGTVQVQFRVDASGKVIETSIHGSSGFPALDAAALEVADVVRFSPALNRDKKVGVRIALPITFVVK